jgi:transposase
MDTVDSIPDDIDALRSALKAERAARREAEARAIGAEAIVAHLKFRIATLEHHRYAPSSERGRKLLDQAELQLDEVETDASEAAIASEADVDEAGSVVRSFTRRRPVRGPLPAHLPRERVVIPGPTTCPCCGGALSKLGEAVTETLESVPRQWKVIQTVREKFACRACEKIRSHPRHSTR